MLPKWPCSIARISYPIVFFHTHFASLGASFHDGAPHFRWETQGLEMHGTTILCVRKNGKVVSKTPPSLVVGKVHLVVPLVVPFPSLHSSLCVLWCSFPNMASGKPGSSICGCFFWVYSSTAGVLVYSSRCRSSPLCLFCSCFTYCAGPVHYVLSICY